MVEAAEKRVSVMSMLGWMTASMAVTALAGAYPTWRWAAAEGLWAMLAAAAVVAAVFGVSGVAMIRFFSGKDPTRLAYLFPLSAVRIVACLMAAGAVWAVSVLPMQAYFIWIALFYVTVLLVESVWFARYLKLGVFGKMPGGGPDGV